MEGRVVAAADGTPLHVDSCGTGPDVLVLSGGPGLVNYLAGDRLAPEGMRAWFPEPRGVGRSGGGPHTMAEAVADLEAIRRALGLDAWAVLGDPWPLRQLAELIPRGSFETVPGVRHDFWNTHPATWRQVATAALSERF